MTSRTAAEASAELKALEAMDFEAYKAYVERDWVVRATGENHSPEHWLREADDMAAMKHRWATIDALKVEHSRLLREELDAATPPPLRALVCELRSTFEREGGPMRGEDRNLHRWDELPYEEARLWAAVARTCARTTTRTHASRCWVDPSEE